MRKKFPSLLLLIIFSIDANASIDCDQATSGMELRACSQIVLNEAKNDFNNQLTKLTISNWIPINTKSKILEHYSTSENSIQNTCKALFDSTGSEMYRNNCTTEQIELLTESIKRLICTQQDSNNCRK